MIFEGWSDKFTFQKWIESNKEIKKNWKDIGMIHALGAKDVERVSAQLENFNRECFIITDADEPSLEWQKKYGGLYNWITYKDLGFENKETLGRMKTGKMNKAEIAYSQHLEALKSCGEIVWWKFEAIKLRLADNTFYTVDFFVMKSSGDLEAHEVKGHWMDDARVKIKVAAESFPFRFIAVQKKSRKQGGGWKIEVFE